MKKTVGVLLCVLIAAFALCGCKARDRELANKPVEDKDKTSDVTGVQDGTTHINSGEDVKDKTSKPDDANAPNYDDEVDLTSYKKPGDVIDIDMSKSDPSTENIHFAFNDGMVSSYEYKFGDKTVSVTYTYSDGAAEVFAFMDGVLVADDTVELSAYDSQKGFTVVDGYFFKGFTAK